MHEAILRDFLTGATTGDLLREDLVGAVEELGDRMHRQHVVDMDADFNVTSAHLVRLCDAVLHGMIAPEHLATIGFCFVASDHFKWNNETSDGALVAETVYDWSAPEINYPLTAETVRLFRERLTTGEDVLKKTRMA